MAKGRKIMLVVDDEADIVSSMLDLLTQAFPHVDVVATVSADEALVRAQAGIDLLLTDYKMPTMTGLELARRVQRFHHDLPIILVTAYAGDPDIEDEAIELGVDILGKPPEPAIIVDAVQALI